MKVGYMATLKVADGKQGDFEAAFAEMQKAVAAIMRLQEHPSLHRSLRLC